MQLPCPLTHERILDVVRVCAFKLFRLRDSNQLLSEEIIDFNTTRLWLAHAFRCRAKTSEAWSPCFSSAGLYRLQCSHGKLVATALANHRVHRRIAVWQPAAERDALAC